VPSTRRPERLTGIVHVSEEWLTYVELMSSLLTGQLMLQRVFVQQGSCGEQFREAFSCFVFSEQEPKGIDCVDK
jgi:hypothetical protein